MADDPSIRFAAAVTLSDTVALAPIPRGIFVGTGGNITGRLRGAQADVVFKNVPSGKELAYEFQYIRSTGTTAADIVALS